MRIKVKKTNLKENQWLIGSVLDVIGVKYDVNHVLCYITTLTGVDGQSILISVNNAIPVT